MNHLREVARSILRNPLRHVWSLQGFGMLRLYLGDDVRLHVWDDRFRVLDVTEVHTHPWSFESVVVAGKVVDQTFAFGAELVGKGGPNTEVWKEGVITCGPQPKDPSVRDVRRVPLMHVASATYLAGDSYAGGWSTPHRTRPASGTVTLLFRTAYLSDRDTAFVYWPEGTERVSAEPRPATEREVTDIVGSALDRWF